MARNVKVVTFSFNPVSLKDKPEGQSITDYEIAWLKKNLEQVYIENPDLIVMPEVCDLPVDLPLTDHVAYYEERGEQVLDFMKSVAKEHHCYIAHSAIRKAEDGYNRNSIQMIDRNGQLIGCYDKNYLCPLNGGEVLHSNCRCGRGPTIFECDFGRVGAIICFDWNFEEMRRQYKALKPDLMLFSANDSAGFIKNFFAFDTRSYFVSASGYDCPAEIIDPMGTTLKKSANHYNYIVETLNLDYAIVHLDLNWGKIRAAREKYPLLEIRDVGFIGIVMFVYHGTDTTAKDILKEFEIRDADQYFDDSREYRKQYLSEI